MMMDNKGREMVRRVRVRVRVGQRQSGTSFLSFLSNNLFLQQRFHRQRIHVD